MHFSHDPVFEAGHIEIDQQAYSKVPKPDPLRQKLRFMNWNDLRDRLDFDHHTFLDEQVDPIGNLQHETVVSHRHQNLATNGESSLSSSCARHAWYADSSNPGPSTE